MDVEKKLLFMDGGNVILGRPYGNWYEDSMEQKWDYYMAQVYHSRYMSKRSCQWTTQMCAYFYTTHNSHPSHQPRRLQRDKWLKLMHYKNTMEFYLAIKQNEIITFAIKWINLEIIMLSEVSQTQTNISLHIFLQMQNLD